MQQGLVWCVQYRFGNKPGIQQWERNPLNGLLMTRYSDINHSQLCNEGGLFLLFRPNNLKQPVFTLEIEPGQHLLFRKRSDIPITAPEKQKMHYLAGWHRVLYDEHGRQVHIKSISYIYPSGLVIHSGMNDTLKMYDYEMT